MGQIMICFKIALSYITVLPAMQTTVGGFSRWKDFKTVYLGYKVARMIKKVYYAFDSLQFKYQSWCWGLGSLRVS